MVFSHKPEMQAGCPGPVGKDPATFGKVAGCHHEDGFEDRRFGVWFYGTNQMAMFSAF
jgi:hypothetical protein